ncbi:MAG: agmatine deiminase family protein, partial [Bacteroidales bacterium]|nr:agmatine deiminase family protein [Bacteroidales bacterium]
MKKFLFVIVLGALSIVLGTSFYSISKSKKYTPRADFEPSSSTMVVWANSYKDNLLPFISTISKYDHVTVVVKDRNSIEQVKSELHGQYASMKNISFSMNPSQESAEDIWIRDFGPMIITNGSKMKVVDFRYYINDYSNFDSRFAAKNKMEVVRSKVLSVGGAREFNGKGTVILVKSHEKKHNKNLSLEEIENEFKMVLGQEKVIWLEEGLPYDDDFYDGPIVDTIYPNGLHGHIDEFCRFA